MAIEPSALQIVLIPRAAFIARAITRILRSGWWAAGESGACLMGVNAHQSSGFNRASVRSSENARHRL
jgi:hypothetical protein